MNEEETEREIDFVYCVFEVTKPENAFVLF